ncbi:MAG: hypothetical protein J5746_08045 [Victivallales bacterium]|nr:hypothetical protein [Victivallales bacterium]
MNKASIQITYITEEAEQKRRLSPRMMLETSTLPCTVELPDAGSLFTIEEGDKGVQLCPEANTKVFLNGKELQGKAHLSAGDKIKAGGYLLDFHYKHEARGLSTSSKLLSLGAKLVVACLIICELAIMLGLSSILKAENLFEGSVARQRISFEIIRVQEKLARIKTDDPMEQAMLALLNDDVARRMSYMGDFGDMLSPRQRRNMNRDLRRLDMLLDSISQKGSILPEEKVNLEEAVKDIIRRHKVTLP